MIMHGLGTRIFYRGSRVRQVTDIAGPTETAEGFTGKLLLRLQLDRDDMVHHSIFVDLDSGRGAPVRIEYPDRKSISFWACPRKARTRHSVTGPIKTWLLFDVN